MKKKCWKDKSVGNGDKICWGKAKMFGRKKRKDVGRQKCWERQMLGRQKML